MIKLINMLNIQKNIKLANYTTLKIGGLANYFVVVKNELDLKEALKFAKDKKISLFIFIG